MPVRTHTRRAGVWFDFLADVHNHTSCLVPATGRDYELLFSSQTWDAGTGMWFDGVFHFLRHESED